MSTDAKPKSTSKLHGLSSEQRSQVDIWLFKENKSYAQVVGLCDDNLGLDVDISSVGRYFRKEKPRWDRQLTEAAIHECVAVSGASISEVEARYRAVLVKVCEFVLNKAHDLDTASNQRTVSDLVKVIIAARRESNYAQRSALAREKFEFDAATACLMNQIKVEAIMKDASLDDGQRIQKIREELFGTDLPQ